jgi:hypothetical protein
VETGRDDAWKETFVDSDSVQALKGSSVLMRPRNGSLEGHMEYNIEDGRKEALGSEVSTVSVRLKFSWSLFTIRLRVTQ